MGCFGPQVTLKADKGDQKGPTGLEVGRVGNSPSSPEGGGETE